MAEAFGTSVRDTPIVFAEPKGPSFQFSLLYSSVDTRSRTGRKWPVGYKWGHGYERRVTKSGSIYSFGDAFDRTTATFTYNGSTFSETTGDYLNDYSLAWSDTTNIVARAKRIHAGLNVFGPSSCPSGSCGTPTATSPPSPEQGFSASEGFVFAPDPSNTNAYRLIQVVGADGNAMTLTYDSNNCITSMVTALGNVFLFNYSVGGYLTNIHDVAGTRDVYLAYTNDLQVQVTDMGGQNFQYGYDSSGRMTSLKRPNLTGYDTTTIAYATENVTVTLPSGQQRSAYISGGVRYDNTRGIGAGKIFTSWYSWGHTVTKVEDAQGRQTYYTWYDSEGAHPNSDKRVWYYEEPDGTWYYYHRNLVDGEVTHVDQYNAQDNVFCTITNNRTTFSGTKFLEQRTQERKNSSGDVLSRSEETWHRFDNGTPSDPNDDVVVPESRRTWTGTNATDYAETRYVYDTNTYLLASVERLVSGTNTYRTTETYAYDSNRRLVSSTDALTNATYYSYDSVGRVSAVTRTNSAGIALTTTYLYDGLDRLTNAVYADGTKESWSHAPCGCGILSSTDRGGNITTNSYNSNKWLSKVRTWSPGGTLLSQVEYLYNAAGVATNTWDTLTNRTISVYNTAGDLVYSIDPLSRTNQYLYDSLGRQYKTIFPDGTASSNSYDSASRVIKASRLAPASSSTTLSSEDYTYDSLGRRLTTSDPVGTVTSNAYDMAGRAWRTYNLTLGTYTETQWDLLGNVILQIGSVVTNASSSEIAAATVANSYDVLNRLVMTIDSESRTNSYIYDPDWPSQIKYVVNSAGTTNQINYYDTFTGRLLTNITEGVQTVYSYDSLGQVTNTLFADDSSTINIYDGSRLMQTISRTGVTNSFAYDLLGRRTAFTNGLGQVTQYAFDGVGNVTNTTDALNQSTLYDYDVMTRLLHTILPDSRVSTNAYNPLGQLSSRTGAGSVPVSYDYDAAGKMTKLIDGEANKTEFAYDSGTRLVKKTYADGSFYQYGYNPRGWLTNRVDAMNRSTVYSYNNDAQLTNVNYVSDVDVQYAFDTLGRMTSRTDAAGTWVWSYDGDSSRLLSESVSGGAITSSVTYTYHPNTFDLASVGIDSSNRTFYTWEKGRLTQVSNFQFQVSYSYLPNSDLLSEMTNSVFFVRRSYDALSRLVAISNNVGATSVSRFLYTLDSTGRRTARQDVDGSQLSWGYDSFDQLTSASRTNSPNGAADKAYNFQYQYDLVGNHLHEDRGQLDLDGTFNPLNQLTYRKFAGRLDVYGSVDNTGSVVVVGGVTSAPPFYGTTNWWGSGAVNAGSNAIPIVANVGTNSSQTNLVVFMPPSNPQVFLWDRNGNLTNDEQRVFTWNDENRLTSIETTAAVVSNGMAKRRSEFLYDGFGRRILCTDFSGWTNSAYSTTNITRYVRAGHRILAELDSANNITAHHCWGLDLSQSLDGAGGIGGLLSRIQPQASSNQVWLYTFDGNGNVSDVLDTNATVAAHYEYDPFGRVVAKGGWAADLNPWQFSTKQVDSVWGVLHYEYRPYSPELRRFLSRDPTGPTQQYAFCRNSPILLIDLIGLWTDLPGKQQYVAKKEDTLEGLAEYISGFKEDWVCLWPIKVLHPEEYPKVSPCDVYSVENVWSTSGKELNLTVSGGGSGPANVFKGFDPIDPPAVANRIKNESKMGATPIKRLYMHGHGGVGGFELGWLTSLEEAKGEPKAGTAACERAKKREGPLRCWFTTNAEARFFGCESDWFATEFAKKVLRKSKDKYGLGRTSAIGTKYTCGGEGVDTKVWFYPDKKLPEAGWEYPIYIEAPKLWGELHYGEF